MTEIRIWRITALKSGQSAARPAQWPPAHITHCHGRKLDPKSRGPFLPLLSSPISFSPPLTSSPCPSLPLSTFLSSLPFHPFPFSSPPPMQQGKLGERCKLPQRPQTYFAAILSLKNVSGGSNVCFVLWRKTKCADLLKLGLC